MMVQKSMKGFDSGKLADDMQANAENFKKLKTQIAKTADGKSPEFITFCIIS